MLKLLAMKNAYLRDEKGATAIEYGLIAAGIALVILGAVALLGENIEGTFNEIAGAIGGEGGGE